MRTGKQVVLGNVWIFFELTLYVSVLRTRQQESGKFKFLIDGFPRNKDNLDGWTRQMSDKTELQFVLVFDCTQEACTERCLQRGAAGSGRSDDNLESLKKRFQTFYNDSVPIIEHYNAQDLVRKIDGTATAEEVFARVCDIFKA